MPIDLLPILGAAEMQALLAEVLAAAGWTGQGGALEATVEGATVRLKGDHLLIEIEGAQKVAASGENATAAEERLAANRSAAEERLMADLRRRTARVEAALCEALEPAVQQVYVEALKRKAAQLGEVQSVDERRDGAAIELTIKVKV